VTRHGRTDGQTGKQEPRNASLRGIGARLRWRRVCLSFRLRRSRDRPRYDTWTGQRDRWKRQLFLARQVRVSGNVAIWREMSPRRPGREAGIGSRGSPGTRRRRRRGSRGSLTGGRLPGATRAMFTSVPGRNASTKWRFTATVVNFVATSQTFPTRSLDRGSRVRGSRKSAFGFPRTVAAILPPRILLPGSLCAG